MPDTARNSPILRFDTNVIPKKDLAKARDNLSAVVLQDKHLWLGGDEGTCIDSNHEGRVRQFRQPPAFRSQRPAEASGCAEGGDRHRGSRCEWRLPLADWLA